MTPIEAAARAICHSVGARIVGPGQHTASREMGCNANHDYVKRYIDLHWREWVHAAEFAIAAIRAPSDAMIEAGWDVAREESAAATWQAMVDALIDEQPETTP